MTAPVDTPNPGRDPDGNRIIAQTLYDTHGSGGATFPEPLTLFAEQYDATNGRVIRFTPTNRGIGADLNITKRNLLRLHRHQRRQFFHGIFQRAQQ